MSCSEAKKAHAFRSTPARRSHDRTLKGGGISHG